jgi:PAS domain S-box-containing protein
MTTSEWWRFEPTSVLLIGELWHDERRLIGITETDGVTSRYIDISPGATSLLGYTRDEILAMRPGDLVANPDDVTPMVAELTERQTPKDEPVRMKVALRHKEGHLVDATINAHRAFIATREVVITISEPVETPLQDGI